MKIIKSAKEKAPFRGKVLAINRRTAAILAGIAAAAAIFNNFKFGGSRDCLRNRVEFRNGNFRPRRSENH